VERICWKASFRLRNLLSRLMRSLAPSPPQAARGGAWTAPASRGRGPTPLRAPHLKLVKSDGRRKEPLREKHA
jgi:hypothetical protein